MSDIEQESRIRELEKAAISMGAGLQNLDGGLKRVEKMVAQMNTTLLELVGKLDDRYPSKESVDLRIAELRNEIQGENGLWSATKNNAQDIADLKKWMYKVAGGMTLASFLIGIGTAWLYGHAHS